MTVGEKFARSMSLMQSRQLDPADALCREIIAADPSNADAFHIRGIIALQKGQMERAIEFIQQSLRLDPSQPHVHCNLGNAYRDLGRPQEALVGYQSALRLFPGFAGAHFSEGNAFFDLARYNESIASYDRAIANQPDYADAYQNRGNALIQLGRTDEAVESYRRALLSSPQSLAILANIAHALRQLHRPLEALNVLDRMQTLRPGDLDSLISRGNTLLELNRYQEAIACFDTVLQLRPNASDTRNNRGHAWLAIKQFDRALDDFDRLLQVEPDLAEGHCGRGLALMGLERAKEALASFEQARLFRPNFAEALDGVGTASRSLKRFSEALSAFDAALLHGPSNIGVMYRRAVTLRELRRHEEAARAFEKVVTLDPQYEYALGNLLHERLQDCDWTDYALNLATVELRLSRGQKAYMPGALFAVSNSADAQLQCVRQFVRENNLDERAAGAANLTRYHHDRIRLAYISADLREHPVAYLLVGVLELHDRDRFEIFGISLQPAESTPIGTRIEKSFDQFIDVSQRTDAEVVTLLRELEIDIAIDLMGFSGGGRPGILASRPAPIQVNYLGFPGTLGAAYIDYMIADRVVVSSADRVFFSEKMVYLPNSFQPNDQTREIAKCRPSRGQYLLPEHGFVFCCFNSPYKISPNMFDVWMRLLERIEASVLWLGAASDTVKRNLRREAAARGVSAERLVFADRQPAMSEHLARYVLADLFLDTSPYNAHATASDALWAGLPVLTCKVGAFAGRVAASLLTTLGLPELITDSLPEYENVAYKLATTPDFLGDLRERLAGTRPRNPVFDAKGYCRSLESAYRIMWDRWQRDELPEDISV